MTDKEPCTDCDGTGTLRGWPHTTCSTCKGSGRVERGDDDTWKDSPFGAVEAGYDKP